ncbi:MAG TPA: hypothetical protein IAA63_00335 [Candidatus Pullilachnospira stercoravium]|uniref:Uncharacterized protein n=1 Tax=Candidatus Pullilachnospira stercoravium TaxID=2840913 RepID=A0A9D1NSR7_9FIRM|nr:hypothetical protein [Candidatus Pullilachnospira stercoravium]
MKTDKRKNGRKNRRRKYLRLLLVLLLLAVAGGSYSYYALVYRTSTEPQPQRSHTTSEAVYSLESRMKLLHLTPKVREAAFTGRAAEIDYGTYVIPGLKHTETQVFGEKGTSDICTSMTPQGLAVTEDYLFVSSYCQTGTHNSVIYMIDKKSHEFIKEIVLRNKSHVGGLAYDTIHHNLWIAGMSRGLAQVNAISLDQLEEYSFQDEYQPIVYSQSYDLYAISRNSFLTYYNNALYIGYFTENTASVLEEYAIAEDGTLITESNQDTLLLSEAPIALPSDIRIIAQRAQGVAFYKDMILLSHSYGPLPSSLQVFSNRSSIQKLLEEDSALQKIRFPEKLEQIYVDGDDLYVLFESAAYGYRASSLMKVDRILKLDLTLLLEQQ